MTTPLIICGALGRMGRAVIELALSSQAFSIKNGTAREGALENKPAQWPFALTNTPTFEGPAVVIDFSHHTLLGSHLFLAEKNGWPLLVGTTGHDEDNMKAMKNASKRMPILYAPNTSLMANLLITFSEMASKIENVSAYILDIHHQQKKDAPSGTALAIKDALLANMESEQITINSLRIADVVGEHQVTLFKAKERLTLSHQVLDRVIFAEGALTAASFLYTQGPGFYRMSDVLKLTSPRKPHQ